MLVKCSDCRYITTAVEVDPDKPVLVDKYLDRATELDVDALRDQEGNIVICGIMEHIEQVIALDTVAVGLTDCLTDWLAGWLGSQVVAGSPLYKTA
jgi:hypothetical protein